MNRQTIVSITSFAGLGAFTSSLGYSFMTVEFWVFIALAVVIQINSLVDA